MNQTQAFSAFMDLYWAVVQSPLLTLAEKTAAIEAAEQEFNNGTTRPAAYKAIVRRLAEQPPKDDGRETPQAAQVPAKPPAAKAQAGSAKPVAPRAGR